MKKAIPLIKIILLTLIFTFESNAQDKKKPEEEKPIEFRVLPYINYSRTLDFQAGLVGMMMYRANKKDTVSTKSISGATAIYSTNNSFVAAVFNRWFLSENDWRITFYFGTGALRSQTFINEVEIPGFYDFTTDITLVNIDAQRKIYKKWFGGLGLTYNKSNSVFDELPFESDNEDFGFSLSMSIDDRDKIYYPKKGFLARTRWNSFPTWFGNEEDINTLNIIYNHYKGMRNNKDVLALRASAQMGIGTVNFERQVVIGGTDIRGYSEGKFRGDQILAIQGEYRYNFGETWGMVGFAGLATMYGSINEEFNGRLYPGVGAGIRYTVFEDNNFNIGLDGAVGREDWGLYFRIGEAF